MTAAEVLRHRLHNQRLVRGRPESPADVVRWLGAVQAQDYSGSLWAVGLRAGDRTDADVEQAVRDKEIVRTWPMRGTLHFVPAVDMRWMLGLLTPRIVARASALRRRLEIDPPTLTRAAKVIVAALQGGRLLTRGAMYRLLASSRISPEGQRGLHRTPSEGIPRYFASGQRERTSTPSVSIFQESHTEDTEDRHEDRDPWHGSGGADPGRQDCIARP